MKKTNKLLIIFLSMLLTVCVISCKKDKYLTDGGLENAKTPFSTYDYLKNNQYHQFDTVLMLIDHFNLKDSINKAKTFFAFDDMALHLLAINLKTTSISQLEDSVTQNLFRQYMFRQTITLAQATANEVVYPNNAGVRSAIKEITALQTVYLDGGPKTYPYNQLEYVKINGQVDGSPGVPATDSVDVALACQTTGIQTSSGTTLHVFVNNAPLNRK